MDLERDYGLTVTELVPHAGGFATEGWVADRRWFVKRWKEGEQPAGLSQPGELRALGLPVVEPLRTVRGELSALSGSRAYAVFPYIEGRTARWADWRVVARALRQVHDAPARVTLPPADVSEPHIRKLGRYLNRPWIADRAEVLAAAIARLDDVRMRLKPVRDVVCHTDLQGWIARVDTDLDVFRRYCG